MAGITAFGGDGYRWNCYNLTNQLAQLDEIGRLNAGLHPHLINCMSGPTETPEELYHNLIEKSLMDAIDEEIVRDLKAPRLWNEESDGVLISRESSFD